MLMARYEGRISHVNKTLLFGTQRKDLSKGHEPPITATVISFVAGGRGDPSVAGL